MIEIIFISYLLATLILRIVQYKLSGLPLYYKSSGHFTKNTNSDQQPFVSIHLPICDEPPHVVIQTIKSLLNIDYEQYEIIVLDNNTQNENKWRPVESYCRDKTKITFTHIEQLSGHKAGALNKCLDYSNPDSEYILIVDADYKVNKGILKKSIGITKRSAVDLLQFPQSYRNKNQTSEISLEYRSYFRIFMNMASWFNCVLSTGTLSFVRRSALQNIGGWDEDTITEDAELGVRFLLSGYNTRYINQEMGRGLVPYGHQSFKNQRDRWVTGNIQVLKKHFRSLLTSSHLNLKQKAGIFMQLTAWVDFKIIALCLFAAIHVFLVSPYMITAFWLYFMLMIILKIGMYQRVYRGLSVKKLLRIYFINQSTALATGLYWIRALTGTKLRFEVTNKEQLN